MELQLNKKKQKLTSRILSIPQQGPNLSNLMHIELLTPRSTLFFNSIKLATGNVQSLKNKEQTLLHELIEQVIDIMVVTETWLTKDDTVWLDSCDFNKNTCRIQSAHHQTGEEEDWLSYTYPPVMSSCWLKVKPNPLNMQPGC